jgi:hypothetical protein
MGIEELIGFLFGVACGGLFRYLRGSNNAQAGPGEVLLTQHSELGEQSTDLAAEATQASLARRSELSEQASPASAAVDVGSATQPLVAVEPSTASSLAVEEKRAELKTSILDILRSSEEGLTLSAIAEKLKRHFASIIGPVRLLIEEGLIEKQDKTYKIRGAA